MCSASVYCALSRHNCIRLKDFVSITCYCGSVETCDCSQKDFTYEVVVFIPSQRLPLMLLGANWTECATMFPRACTPFCRAGEYPVIAVLLISVNIVRGAEEHGYPTATEVKRILQRSDGV